MEELHRQGDVVELPPHDRTDPVEWAARELGIAVNPHDRLQVSFVEELRAATVEELRVIACTYEGLDAIAGSQRQVELSWKAAASQAALDRRLVRSTREPGR